MTRPDRQPLAPEIEAAIQRQVDLIWHSDICEDLCGDDDDACVCNRERLRVEARRSLTLIAALAVSHTQQAELTSLEVLCGCGQRMDVLIGGADEMLLACPNPTCKPGQVNVARSLPPAPDGSQEER